MSNISANTLFHFTDTKVNLLSILGNGFHPFYSKNGVEQIEPAQEDFEIPMVSFCDIPLSQVQEHINFYGSYAIGLSKEWGIKNNINPVHYNTHNSIIMKGLDIINFIGDNIKDEYQFAKLFNSLIKFVVYFKFYDGYSYQKNKKEYEKKLFYNEKEWRYVPSIEEMGKFGLYPLIKRDTYNEFQWEDAKEKLKVNFKLGFSPNNIHYIIVKTDSEILEMQDFLLKLKDPKYTDEVKKLLMSRLLTIEQIKNDF